MSSKLSWKSIKTFALAAVAVASFAAPRAYAATVDLLVLYDGYSNDYFSGDVNTAMNGWVTTMNNAYRDSNVDIQLRLVGVKRYDYASSSMDAVLGAISKNGSSTGSEYNAITSLADQTGADMVSYLHKSGSCGIGWVAVSKQYARNVVSPNCGPLTMVHELGHNMGLNHSRRQGDTGGSRYPYALGYGVDKLFSTVMAYSSAFNTRRFSRFSNPDIKCFDVPCGVPVGRSDQAYATLALNNVRDELTAFRSGKPGAGLDPSAWYTAVNKASSQCLDNKSWSTKPGTPVIQWACHGGANQQWQFRPVGSAGYYQIVNRQAPLLIDVPGYATASRTPLGLWSLNTQDNDLWKPELIATNAYAFRNKHSGKCIDVHSGSQQSGLQMEQWECNQSGAQVFTVSRQ